MKGCPGCDQVKPMDQFWRDKNRPLGVRSRCIDCERGRYRKYGVAMTQAQRNRCRESRWRQLGIKDMTVALYDEMFLKQVGLCALCDQPERRSHHSSKTPYVLCVDHDHETGRVRGLLCRYCNTNLGGVESRIDRVVQYLRPTS